MRSSFPAAISEKILNEYIKNETLRPGDKLPTVRDLTEKYAPVSSNTVVHALSILERSGWIVRKQGSGCFVTEGPSREKSSKVSLLSFIGTCDDSKLILDLHSGIDEVCKQHQNHIAVSAFTRESIKEERVQVQRMVDAGCKSIILFPVVRTADQLKDDYLTHEFRDVNIILVDMAYPELKRPRVIFDNRMAGFEITDYLINKGHRKIAFMSIEKDTPELVNYSLTRRFRGFNEALKKHSYLGVSGEEWILGKLKNEYIGSWNDIQNNIQERLYDSIKQWKNQQNRPTAVLAICDSIAIDMISIAGMMDIDIPADLTVAAFDNLLPPSISYPEFVTTDSDFMQMGAVAARMLINAGDTLLNEQTTYILPVSLMHRRQQIPVKLVRNQTLF